MLKTIISDCDGVILDWRNSFAAWMGSIGEHVADDSGDVRYDMTTLFPEITSKQIFDRMVEFAGSVEFSRLPYYPGAIEGILNLRQTFPEARFVVLTAVGDAANAHELRAKNLERLGIDELILCPFGQSKRSWLDTMHGPAIFIEDHPDQAAAGRDAGHATYLVEHVYNRDVQVPGVTRVSGWIDIARHAIDTFGRKAA